MMRQRIHIALLVVLPLAASAQDVHFAQFYNAPLWLNPALTGHIAGDQRLSIIHRDQWQSMGTPFRTDALSYDAPLLRGRMNGRYLGVGVSAYSDKAGRSNFGDAQANLSLAYGLQAGSNSTLAFGLQGGYGQRSAMLSELRWDSQFNGSGYDPSLASGESFGDMSRGFIDLSAGVVWSGERKDGILWTVGAGAFHLNSPEVSLFSEGNDRLLRRYMAHGELRIETKRWTVLPKFYAGQQGAVREINYGALLHRRIGIDSRYTTDKTSSAFYFGAFHRWGDAIVPTFLYEHKRMLAIGLSYDVNISPLRSYTRFRGGAELSIQWIGSFTDKRRRLPNAKPKGVE
jgi:type IX secretion system PorP/SprF family membrane protein